MVDVFREPSICGQSSCLRCWFSDLLLPRALFPQTSQTPSHRPSFPLPRASPPGPGVRIKALFAGHSYSITSVSTQDLGPGSQHAQPLQSPPPCLQRNRHSWPASPQASFPSRKASQGRAPLPAFSAEILSLSTHLLGPSCQSPGLGSSHEDPSPSFSPASCLINQKEGNPTPKPPALCPPFPPAPLLTPAGRMPPRPCDWLWRGSDCPCRPPFHPHSSQQASATVILTPMGLLGPAILTGWSICISM